MRHLDILIVYSDLAVSASVDDSISMHPFSLNSKQAGYNQSYEYFLEHCQKQGLAAGLSVSDDVIAAGSCSSFWTYEQKRWIKNRSEVKSTQIFDKLAPATQHQIAKRALLFSDSNIQPFTDPKVLDICFDKYNTYTAFPEFSIPTVEIVSHKLTDISQAVAEIQSLTDSHKNKYDFQKEIILKDRFGSGGNMIYKIEDNFAENIHDKMKDIDSRFILQPFVKFDVGFTYKNHTGPTDIRLIFQNNSLFQTYFRFAKAGDFRCNEHLGGSSVYVSHDEIPKKILSVAEKIVAKINMPRSLYALDFIVSNAGNVYLVEGNNNPGINWDSNKKIDEEMGKRLIESIIDEFIYRIRL